MGEEKKKPPDVEKGHPCNPHRKDLTLPKWKKKTHLQKGCLHNRGEYSQEKKLSPWGGSANGRNLVAAGGVS